MKLAPMKSNKSLVRIVPSVIAVTLMAAMAFDSLPSAAAQTYRLEFGGREQTSELRLSIGKSQIINSPEALDQVVIGNPAVADIKLLSSRQVLILGSKPGHTNLVFRNKDRALIAVMDVVVGYDMDGIKKKIYESLPAEKGIEIRGVNDSVIISGEASSLLAMDTAVAIASSFVPKDKVINHLQVGGGQQVMLEAKIAEVARSSMKEFGFNITGSGAFSGGRPFEVNSKPLSLLSGSLIGNPLFHVNDPHVGGALDSLDLTLDILETKGLAKTLAEPNIVALSGQEASFLAGGEVPIPVAQTGTTTSGAAATAPAITVTYKEFGVGLKFTPTVLDSNKINLKLAAEVSALDTVHSVSWGGGAIPAITTRRTGTTVEMADGQSFAIAGLMQADMNNAINQLPGLGDIPVLGALFRSSKFQRNETELVVVVTPRLVKPTSYTRIRLPTDNVVPPSDAEMYLLGRLHGKVSNKAPARASDIAPAPSSTSQSQGGMDGTYGHQL